MGGLSLPSSSPVKGRDAGCSSHSPIKPSIELGRSVISVTKRYLEKEVFKCNYKGSYPIPALKGEDGVRIDYEDLRYTALKL